MSLRLSSKLFSYCKCNRVTLKPIINILGDRYFTEAAESKQTKQTFKDLLDESLLMKFGRADNKCVVGKITEVCNDDLYVDFGGKFEAVVKKPEEKSNFYKKGSLVRLILRKFEVTGEFLGDSKHITLCEADALLVGPYSMEYNERRKQQK